MDTATFWGIIEDSRAKFDPGLLDGNMDEQLRRLETTLAAMAPETILEFQREFDERMSGAYRWDLWGAAYVIEGGCSDDGFMDFRGWLISMGSEVYEAALRDPQTLIDVADAPGVEVTSFEEILYVARQVYEQKTGQDMPDSVVERPTEPVGEPWSEDSDDLARRFPKLWAKYGDS